MIFFVVQYSVVIFTSISRITVSLCLLGIVMVEHLYGLYLKLSLNYFNYLSLQNLNHKHDIHSANIFENLNNFESVINALWSLLFILWTFTWKIQISRFSKCNFIKTFYYILQDSTVNVYDKIIENMWI